MTTFTRAVTVAAGVFAAGHLGELTQYLPFELVDDVLAQTKTVQRRLRDLPSRVGVYFVVALGMYPRLGYARVWAKLTAGLAGLEVPRPSEKALRDLRRRLGPAPLKALFEVVAGPLAQPATPGVRFGGRFLEPARRAGEALYAAFILTLPRSGRSVRDQLTAGSTRCPQIVVLRRTRGTRQPRPAHFA